MGKIVWNMSVSLDGYMEAPGNDISWHRVGPELHQHMNDTIAPASGFLMGRRTWSLMEDYWPTADQDPDAPPQIVEFAAIWRDKPKVVFSRTLTDAGDAELVREVDPDDIRARVARADGELRVGGAELAGTFLRLGLVDELWQYVNPLVLGEGTPMLPRPGPRVELELMEARSIDGVVVLLRHAVVRD